MDPREVLERELRARELFNSGATVGNSSANHRRRKTSNEDENDVTDDENGTRRNATTNTGRDVGTNSKSKKPLTRRLFLRGEKTNSNERETRKRRGRFLRAVQIGFGADNGDDEEDNDDVNLPSKSSLDCSFS